MRPPAALRTLRSSAARLMHGQMHRGHAKKQKGRGELGEREEMQALADYSRSLSLSKREMVSAAAQS